MKIEINHNGSKVKIENNHNYYSDIDVRHFVLNVIESTIEKLNKK
jgi:hypothetical protein